MPRTTKKPAAAHLQNGQALRDRALAAALPDVAFDGWTPALLVRAAEKSGIKDIEDIFPNGIGSLLAHFSDWADRRMEERILAQKGFNDLRIRERIAAGVTARLDVLAPYKPAVSAALAGASDPRRAAALPKQVWRTADRIWWLAGDTATDWNHYSKRTLLSGVLASTTLYWLSDVSEGHADTKAFLERRISNVLAIGQRLGSVRGLISRFTPRRRSTHT